MMCQDSAMYYCLTNFLKKICRQTHWGLATHTPQSSIHVEAELYREDMMAPQLVTLGFTLGRSWKSMVELRRKQ